jgi:anti-anti-sigma factor
MNVSTTRTEGIDIVRVGEARLVYAMLPTFSETMSTLLEQGTPKIVIDMSRVVYIDSATIGCLMDLYRQATQVGGAVKLAGVQKRVETMLTMTGAQNFIELHDDESSAVESFRE